MSQVGPTQSMRFTFNCLYVEVVFITYLFGIFCYLLGRYLTSKHGDSLFIKGVVLALTAVMLATTVFQLYFKHYLFVDHFGEYTQFSSTRKFAWLSLPSTTTAGIANGFFAQRVYRFTRNVVLVLVVLALSLASIGASIGVAAQYRPGGGQSRRVIPHTITYLACMVVADGIVALALTHVLIHHVKGWKRTFPNILRLILEAQVIPLVLTVVGLIIYCIAPTSFLVATVISIQAYMHSTGAMYALTARVQWAGWGASKVVRSFLEAYPVPQVQVPPLELEHIRLKSSSESDSHKSDAKTEETPAPGSVSDSAVLAQ